MDMKLNIFAVIIVCHVKFLDTSITNIPNYFRQFSDNVINDPVNLETAEVAGNVLATLIGIPWTIGRFFGVDIKISPPFVPAELTNKFVGEYTAGLNNEDIQLTIEELINKYGYDVEDHEVVTEDGYILKLQRIPNNGTVVFLMHGILGSADDFIVAGPDDGLAYLLANKGYDVWMGNARGNKYSRHHVKLHPSEDSFWDFSWHEIGLYDLPAMIDYVLEKTNTEKLKYIGHSQGTTAFFVMASEKPQYNDKIALTIAMAPVAYVSNIKAPLVTMLAPGGPIIHNIAKAVGASEFLPDNVVIRLLKKLMCGTGNVYEILCSNVMFLALGFDNEHLNVTNLPVVFGHFPSGASLKQLAHYAQGVVSHQFRQFDYGEQENLERYGSETPPSYALEAITTPISLFYSEDDTLADPRDVDELYNKLNSTIDIYKIPCKSFSHMDFFLAIDFKKYIYNRLYKLLEAF